ncbi:GATA zinc finger domain-containing protein 14-like [Salvia divinorum]|uniref:GATA zinc finger domain-containing protein 14-like n=1 Tax=Salvia divinorum TaxID=28513 RepID=A0ABD1GZ41_SALDI
MRGQTTGIIEAQVINQTGQVETSKTSMFPLISEGSRAIKFPATSSIQIKCPVGSIIRTLDQAGISTILKGVVLIIVFKEILTTTKHLQSNMQSNNDVVHKLQDAQLEQKAAMDMMAKQLSQIATSLNEMRENDGMIPATVKMPGRENIRKRHNLTGR